MKMEGESVTQDSSSATTTSSTCQPKPSKISFDWLISNRLGEFGAYQKKIFIILGLPWIACAVHALSWVFLGANVKYRCQLDGECVSNATYSALPLGRTFNESFPTTADEKWSQCEKFNVSTGKHDRISCDGKYVFDNAQYKSSARIDFELICGNTVWYTVAETLFKSGVLVGSIFYGSLSDRFGRRPVFFYALCQQVVFGLIAVVAPNYMVFVIARFLLGMAGSGVLLVSFVIAMELVGKKRRTSTAVGLEFFFSSGYIAVGILAYFIREWRYLQLAIALPGVLLLSYYWFMPESIRWLLAKGRKDDAIKILKKVATCNKVEVSDLELSQLSGETSLDKKSFRFRDILKYRKTMLRSLNVFFCWFVNSGVYYGLALNSGNLGGNDYVNFILSGVSDVPGYILLLFTLDRFGRRRTVCTCMIISGLFLVACGFIPKELTWLRVTFNMFGKSFNAASFSIIYIFSAELFPTVIRNSFMGISSVMARVGSILSDYVILSQIIWKPLPHLIFGVVSLTSGLLTLLLPETLGERLPETMEDGENFGTAAYDNGTFSITESTSTDSCNNIKDKKESRF